MNPPYIHARLKAIAATLPKGAHVDVTIVAHREGLVEAVCYPLGLCGDGPRIAAEAESFEEAITKLESAVATREWMRDALAKLDAKQAKERAALLSMHDNQGAAA